MKAGGAPQLGPSSLVFLEGPLARGLRKLKSQQYQDNLRRCPHSVGPAECPANAWKTAPPPTTGPKIGPISPRGACLAAPRDFRDPPEAFAWRQAAQRPAWPAGRDSCRCPARISRHRAGFTSSDMTNLPSAFDAKGRPGGAAQDKRECLGPHHVKNSAIAVSSG